jgi:predicted RNA binding protein YcfA (HicA-like mRNA interferase family)
MPRLTPIHYKRLLKVFQAYGCEYRGKEGSHHVLRFSGARRAVVIPEYFDLLDRC